LKTVCSSSNSDEDLLEKARLLREEAKAMEEDLRTSRPMSKTFATSKPTTTPTIYTKLEDSVWTISYRFSSQPAPENDEKDDNTAKNKFRIFYSGKMDVRLKADGYSERMQQAPSNADPNSNDIDVVKIWGWDRETSNEDGKDYVLFSMDVQMRGSDPDLPSQKERYYFQARVDDNGTGGIELKDGTITVKKDVAEQTKGRWGLFNVAGILSQFRYCGDFVAKPSS
jgi:hypothetical protein